MKENVMKCRFCGKNVMVITWGVYRKIVVDAEAVMVACDPEGEEYVRYDGSKVRAREVPYESGEPAEPAYRPHRDCDRRERR